MRPMAISHRRRVSRSYITTTAHPESDTSSLPRVNRPTACTACTQTFRGNVVIFLEATGTGGTGGSGRIALNMYFRHHGARNLLASRYTVQVHPSDYPL